MVYLLLAVLAGLIVSCQRSPTTTESFAPPYLRLHPCGGRPLWQQPGTSDWVEMEGEITVEDAVWVGAEATEGGRLCLGDESTIDLMPGARVELRNPHIFPRLQVTLEEGALLFEAQRPAYEFLLPVCTVTLLGAPTRLKIEIGGETTRLVVEEGGVNCALEAETLTIFACWEMVARSAEDITVSEFCSAIATATASAMAPTATNTFTPFPTYTPTRVILLPTSTPTSPPPT
ncbi:MAG TPA: hypothetical protein EYH30_06850, partial [Anaerolineales bacterium]|nr:hypothetical protein [Anaerolineales bacterium]